ncbi:hypothetical protein HPULCUR_006066 [Helicostylum pulchrum]|uniref:Uncharacterized protein n=1 Tax=Helicostylum pulchrum TaxID=562976 RepID=A0ABP9Y233_9FUNG
MTKLKKDAEDIVVTPIEQEKTNADLFFVDRQREKIKARSDGRSVMKKERNKACFESILQHYR